MTYECEFWHDQVTSGLHSSKLLSYKQAEVEKNDTKPKPGKLIL